MSSILLASHNRHKRDEIRRVLEWPEGSVLCPSEWGDSAPEPDEDQPDHRGNAILKARAFSRWSGLPALADDSGLAIDALDGRPGVRSARFAGAQATDAENVALALTLLAEVPSRLRTARFTCVMVCCHGDDILFEAEGVCEGTIVAEPRGASGFGYDPIFVPSGEDRTFAEMTASEKDRLSHRGRALTELARVSRGRLPSLSHSRDSNPNDSHPRGASPHERS